MSESPSFQLFAGDYYVDTVEWSAEEVGVYTRLLLAQWANGPLTFDIKRLARVAGIDQKKFKKVFATIKSKFKISDEKKIFNQRLEDTREKQRKYRESQAEKGKKRAAQRWKKDSRGYDTGYDLVKAGLVAPDSSSSSSSLDSKEKDLKAAFSLLDQIEILKPEPGETDPEDLERDTISDMSMAMVNDSTIDLANQLSLDGFQKAHEWLQRQRTFGMNSRATLYTLKQCKKYHPDKPWAYCDKIMKIENGNFNERDSIRNHR